MADPSPDPFYRCSQCGVENSAWEIWKHLTDPNSECSSFIYDKMEEVGVEEEWEDEFIRRAKPLILKGRNAK